MNREELVGPPVHGEPEETLPEETNDVSLEMSWPLLDWDGEWPAWGPDLKPAGAGVVDEENFARTRTWDRRPSRPWVGRTSRCNSN